MRTALLGLLLHFFIAFGVVATYLVATRIMPGSIVVRGSTGPFTASSCTRS